MDDADAPDGRQPPSDTGEWHLGRWIVGGAVLVVLVVAIGLLALPNDDEPAKRAGPGSGVAARARLAERHGDPYVGSIGDVTAPAALRRTLRVQFRRRHGPAATGSPDAAVKHCEEQLTSTDVARGKPVVLLAEATVSDQPSVVVAVVDRGRVVAFVLDAGTCEVRVAQSL